MIIYADVLIFTNVIIDYILLTATACAVKRNYSVWRIVLASLIGGASTLYIFIDSGIMLIDLLYKLLTGVIMIAVLNGFKRGFLMSLCVFLGLSFLLNGAVVFIGGWFGSGKIFSSSFINYFDISPVLLIVISAVIFVAMKVIQRATSLKNTSIEATLEISVQKHNLTYSALIDSGNMLTDPFGNSQIFIVSYDCFNRLCERLDNKELKRRSRVIPIKTVQGGGVLNAIRCDKGTIILGNDKYSFDKPIVAETKEKIAGGYDAIVPKHSLDRICDNNV